MKKNDIINSIQDYVESQNMFDKGIRYSIAYSENQKREIENFSNDIRLYENDYLDNSITIYAFAEDEIIAKTTIYFLNYNMYKNIYFWSLNGNVLEKKYLSDFKEIIGEICIILAYSQISINLKDKSVVSLKYMIIKFYIDLYKEIICKLKIFCYIEPTGVLYIDQNSRDKEKLIIGQDINIKTNQMGKVANESVVADKIAHTLGLYKVDNLFHYISGGSIYSSKYLE